MEAEPDKESEKKPSHILDEVLDEPEPSLSSHIPHPVWVDILLAIGLLVAMGAFAAGLVKMYVSHSAEQSITERKYDAAIALLEGAPFPDLFSPPGSEPRELLNQALYLDAMEKLDAYSEDPDAIKELEKIDASSRFFELAQEILKEHFKPSSLQLQSGTEETVKIEPTEKMETPAAPVDQNAKPADAGANTRAETSPTPTDAAKPADETNNSTTLTTP